MHHLFFCHVPTATRVAYVAEGDAYSTSDYYNSSKYVFGDAWNENKASTGVSLFYSVGDIRTEQSTRFPAVIPATSQPTLLVPQLKYFQRKRIFCRGAVL